MANDKEKRFIIVYPQVNYNQPRRAAGGQYQPIDPLLTRKQLEEHLPRMFSSSMVAGNGAGFRIYEVSRYVPVKTRVEFDGEPIDMPENKTLTAKEERETRALIAHPMQEDFDEIEEDF